MLDLATLAGAAMLAAVVTTILIRIRSEFTIPLLPWKLFAAAFSPQLAMIGFILALYGFTHRACLTIALGLYSAIIAAYYTYSVLRPSHGFDRVFGHDWQSRIPPTLKARMLSARYGRWPIFRQRLSYRNDVIIGRHLETGDPILADIWQPPPGIPHTHLGVIYLHGSGWHYLKKDFFTRSFFQQLANEGHVIADVAYTMAPRATIREMLADVYRAVAWMKQNAGSLGIDPDHIVLAGGSAGAHLALLAAYAPDHPDLKPSDVTTDTHVRGVISYYGLGDLRLAQEHLLNRYGRIGHHHNRIDRALMFGGGLVGKRAGFMPAGSTLSGPGYLIPAAVGGTPDAVSALYDMLSPLTYVNPQCPPTLLFHGSHDFALDVVQSRRLYAALQKANVPAVYVEFPFTEHVFDLFFSPLAPAFQAATYDTERFLAMLL